MHVTRSCTGDCRSLLLTIGYMYAYDWDWTREA